jgi:hypothetical protein
MCEMIYKDLDSLSLACIDRDKKDVSATSYLSSLLQVYFNAYYNPPEGVIGVGVISYAEYVLQEYQKDKV